MSVTRNKTKQELVQEIESALGAVDFGSIEIYVQDKTVTQITVRNIKKTSINIPQQEEENGQQNIENSTENVFSIRTGFRRTD